MTGHVHEGEGIEVRAAHFHRGDLRADVHGELLVAILHQVRERGGVRVPITTAVVLQQGDLVGALGECGNVEM